MRRRRPRTWVPVICALLVLVVPGIARGARAVPEPPRDLTATILSPTSVALYWYDPSSVESGFKIERKTDGGAWEQIKRVGANGLSFNNNSYVDSGVDTQSHTYTYRIRAFNASGDSEYSNEAAAAAPPIADGFDFPVGDREGNGPYIRYDNGELCTQTKLGFNWYVPFDITDPNYPDHTGEDWNGACGGDTDRGTPVYAAGNGRVVFAGYVPKSWGNVVLLAHQLSTGEVVYTQYAHEETIDSSIAPGGVVCRRQQLGTIGKGTGLLVAHLHFEVRRKTIAAGNWPGNQETIHAQYFDPSDRTEKPGSWGESQPGFVDFHRTLGLPGQLDAGFGSPETNCGKVTTDLGGTADTGEALAIQDDGKLVLAGTAGNPGATDFGLARYLSDGALDTTFGPDGDGTITIDFGSVQDQAYGLVIQPDGKLVVAGTTFNGSDNDFAIARYLSDGTPDLDFDGDGKQTTDFGESRSEVAYAAAIQSDGQIVVAGADNVDFILARYLSNGSLDPGFGTGGTVRTDFFGGQDDAYGLQIQPDGRLVAAGLALRVTDMDFALARYDSNGSLDPSFGNQGKVTTAFGAGSLDWARAVALQPDGKIVAAGFTNAGGGEYNFALARYSGVDGSLDRTFSRDGRVVTFHPELDWAFALVVQPDGRLVAAGITAIDPPLEPSFALARYTAEGHLDQSFGSGGFVITDLGSEDHATSLALQSDGKLVAGGWTGGPGGGDLALVRYYG